jgi:hypothetical protein
MRIRSWPRAKTAVSQMCPVSQSAWGCAAKSASSRPRSSRATVLKYISWTERCQTMMGRLCETRSRSARDSSP